MTHLSVNINKIATLRNARGENMPDLLLAAKNIQKWGADGITVHPRPDERHIRYEDVRQLRDIVTTEFNIEGNPLHQPFLDLVIEVRPEQVTLVPDSTDQLTSDHGWDTEKNQNYLQDVITMLKSYGMRVSIFIDPKEDMIRKAASTGTDRVELYTDDYAQNYSTDREKAVAPYIQASRVASEIGLGVNAGHALDLSNLDYLHKSLVQLDEVSIGHALISDALYLGLQNTVQLYKRQLIDND